MTIEKNNNNTTYTQKDFTQYNYDGMGPKWNNCPPSMLSTEQRAQMGITESIPGTMLCNDDKDVPIAKGKYNGKDVVLLSRLSVDTETRTLTYVEYKGQDANGNPIYGQTFMQEEIKFVIDDSDRFTGHFEKTTKDMRTNPQNVVINNNNNNNVNGNNGNVNGNNNNINNNNNVNGNNNNVNNPGNNNTDLRTIMQQAGFEVKTVDRNLRQQIMEKSIAKTQYVDAMAQASQIRTKISKGKSPKSNFKILDTGKNSGKLKYECNDKNGNLPYTATHFKTKEGIIVMTLEKGNTYEEIRAKTINGQVQFWHIIKTKNNDGTVTEYQYSTLQGELLGDSAEVFVKTTQP